MGSFSWNPWHGCLKISAGCKNCYVYRIDARHDKDSSIVTKNRDFDLPIKRKRNNEYKIPPNSTVYTCFSSDFFIENADIWRAAAWDMIKQRSDLHFWMTTKRIERLGVSLPDDWGEGYENVTICCTVENQDRADFRLPIYKAAPIRHKIIICEPLLERIDLSAYLGSWVQKVVVGGESGDEARECDFEWVLQIRDLCAKMGVSFWFKQTGARFIKDGKLYKIPRSLQISQAWKAGINI